MQNGFQMALRIPGSKFCRFAHKRRRLQVLVQKGTSAVKRAARPCIVRMLAVQPFDQ